MSELERIQREEPSPRRHQEAAPERLQPEGEEQAARALGEVQDAQERVDAIVRDFLPDGTVPVKTLDGQTEERPTLRGRSQSQAFVDAFRQRPGE